LQSSADHLTHWADSDGGAKLEPWGR
jgi:hypothetical protein